MLISGYGDLEYVIAGETMFPLGSEQNPLALKVGSKARLDKVIEICEHYGFTFTIGLEFPEDISDLKKAIKQRMKPTDVYSPCPCGSGQKYKFCCAKKDIDLDL